ncbi:hopene-associated glycosyltransferase HpnB [Alicyclobacillus sacchari]|uniref:Hopene-associated glycosyltransferase HpnB n=1 Tax=Alicyclobacillus sacchari TaxID=392010 RepID=A0A4R8LLW0_9BACL|nr:glycosyltransferase [Alicyclobacillus sacchari]TDY46265.1 hopene-associated glycosyltransferase HpnB [Alicyclobacillus sacchari]
MPWFAEIISSITFIAWLFLLLCRGLYWRMDDRLTATVADDLCGPSKWPKVCAVVPARNEAAVLPETLPSLLLQDYPGEFQIILVDDHSEDETSDVARAIAQTFRRADRLQIVKAHPLPNGWAGKVWAMQNGLRHVPADAEYILFTDADIRHPASSLSSLVRHARKRRRDAVSLMVRLHVKSKWETLLIPAFVYFFAKLYPFRWVANDKRKTAAAAGGCILVRRELVQSEEGLTPIAGAVIDDCSLAKLIQSRGGRLWLGLGDDVMSVRRYATLAEIWDMVARTAFVQLNYSVWLLIGTVIGMILLYLAPIVTGIAGVCLALSGYTGWIWTGILGLAAWCIMSCTFVPILRWYQLSPWRAIALPAAGFLYTLMTADSAIRFWQRRAGAWKGRPYEIP